MFDQNSPKPAIRFLTKHVVIRTAQLGWEGLGNGKLLAAAEKEGFEVLVTCERNLKYQQNFTGRTIAIVVLPSGRWPVVRDQLRGSDRGNRHSTARKLQRDSIQASV